IFISPSRLRSTLFPYTTLFRSYPVAVALFGDSALFYAAILALPFNLLSYSLGPLLLAGAARFRWKQLFAPCVVASVIGLVLALRSEEHTSELQSRFDLVCRLLL